MLRKIWAKCVWMYVSVALFVMLLLIPLYHLAYSQGKTNVLQKTEYSIQKNIDRLELELMSLNQYISSLLMSDDVVRMIYYDDSNHYHLRLAMQLSDDLLTSVLPNLFVDDIVLIFSDGEYVVNRGKVTEKKNYYGIAIGYDAYDKETFEDMLCHQRVSFIPMQSMKINTGQPIRAITFVYYGHTKKDAHVVVCVVLSEKHITQLILTDNVSKDSYINITNASGDELLLCNKELTSSTPTSFIELTSEKGMIKASIGIPESVFEDNVSVVRKLIQLYIVITLIGAAIVSVIVGTRQYIPLRDYFRYVQSQGPDLLPQTQTSNISSLMNNSLMGLRIRTNNMVESIKQLKQHNIDMLFRNIFSGIDVRKEDVNQILSGYSALNEIYILLRIYIDGINVSIAETECIFDVLSKRLSSMFSETCILSYDMKVAVLPVNEQGLDKAYNDLRIISEDLHLFGSLTAVLVVSAPHTGAEELSTAYSEVRQLIRHLRIFKDDRLLWRYDLAQEYAASTKTVLCHPEDLLTILHPGNDMHLQQWLTTFLQQMLSLSVDDTQRAVQYYGTVNILDDMSRKWNVPFIAVPLEEDGNYAQISQYFTESVINILNAMNRKNETQATKHEIIQYIDSHYFYADMCLGTLADKFNLSETHISRIIKAQTGMTYTAYIELVRMERAKHLLENSELPIKDIATSLGYENLSTFQKAFKRVYHVPPTVIRQAN